MEKLVAQQIVSHLHKAFDHANEALYVANNFEVGDLRKKFHSVMANVVAEIDLELLEPIYKQFPDLRPAGLDAIKD